MDIEAINQNFGLLAPMILMVKGHTSWVAYTSLASIVLAVIKKNIGQPWVRKAVKQVLNEMHTYAFQGTQNGANFHNRLTLFKQYRGFCWKALKHGRWPFGSWVIPFARSGHVTQKTAVYFLAPDNADEAEGIAGQTFVRDVILTAHGLPDVSGNSPTEADLRIYANKTFVDVDWLREEKSTARSLIGIPVRVSGVPWGVLVVDSRNPAIPNVDGVTASYELVAKVLGVVLERR